MQILLIAATTRTTRRSILHIWLAHSFVYPNATTQRYVPFATDPNVFKHGELCLRKRTKELAGQHHLIIRPSAQMAEDQSMAHAAADSVIDGYFVALVWNSDTHWCHPQYVPRCGVLAGGTYSILHIQHNTQLDDNVKKTGRKKTRKRSCGDRREDCARL